MTIWALGDYGRIAELTTDMSRDLVESAGIGPGRRVLDVGAGTGNTAILAAEAGAEVVALEPDADLLAAGRRRTEGRAVEWAEGTAIDLPYDDRSFDAVVSSIGAMFAPDHAATARELARVCRPGGVVAMANWPPGSEYGRLFALLARRASVLDRDVSDAAGASEAAPPEMWGDAEYAKGLFKAIGLEAETERRVLRLGFTGSSAELAALYSSSFPPIVGTREALDDEDAGAAVDREVFELFDGENKGSPEGPGRWEFEWLLVRVRIP